VAEPAVGAEGGIEEERGDDAADDEERLQVRGADVADVGDGSGVGHGGVVRPVGIDGPVDEQAEEHAEPDEARDDGYDLVATWLANTLDTRD